MADTFLGVNWSLDSQRRGLALCVLDDDEFDAAVRRSNWGPEIEELFERTKPRWYGLWINSPLSPFQSRALLKLYNADNESRGEADDRFDIAVPLRAAVREWIPLAVEVTPPGHVDLGFVTTFVHCPRCKCEGPFPRWRDSYPADLQFCGCCGQAYSPASTYSSVSETALQSFECRQCGRTVAGSSLTDEQLSILGAQDSHQEQMNEFEWLERVAAFYRRCPAAKAFFESRRFALDANDIVHVVPKAKQLPMEWLRTADNDGWEAENAEVMSYLDHHLFKIDSRGKFVNQSLNNWFMEDHPEVRCEVCGGEMRRAIRP